MLAPLQIKVTNEGIDSAKNGMDSLASSSSNLEAKIGSLAKQLLAFISVGKGLQKTFNMQREFDIINASLVTVTKSTANAKEAFDALTKYALETPYAMNEVTGAFIKLVNYGLEPSEKALTSYGNTAASMGKSLDDMVNAVAQASVGNYMSLRQFGILAARDGENLTLQFQGTSTTIKNTSEEIQKYMISLGENQFAGAMAERMKTLEGAVANLADEWDTLFLTVSQSGIGDLMYQGVELASYAINELTAMIESNELAAWVTNITERFKRMGQSVADESEYMADSFSNEFDYIKEVSSKGVSFIIDEFKYYPENVKAFLEIAAIEVFAFFDKLKAYSVSFVNYTKAVFTSTTFDDVGKELTQQLDIINEARQESIITVMDSWEKSREIADKEIEKVKAVRKEYDDLAEAKAKASTGDALAKYEIKGDGSSLMGSKGKKGRGGGGKKNSELDSLIKQLETEEEAIERSYNERMAIIMKYTQDNSSLRDSLTLKVQEEYDKSLKGLEEAKQRERDSLYNGLLTEEEMITQSYERRRQAILDSTAVTEEERIALLQKLSDQHQAELLEMENKRIQGQLKSGEDLFSGLADLAKTYAGEQSSAYKALFAVSKGFALAQAAMSISTGIAKAQELGFPANLAEMARVAAVGVSAIGNINSSNFSGAYDKGGRIPAGKFGLVGEYGPELISGPVNVTSRKETAEIFRNSQEKRGEGSDIQTSRQPPVNIYNVYNQEEFKSFLSSDTGSDMVVNIMQRNRTSLT